MDQSTAGGIFFVFGVFVVWLVIYLNIKEKGKQHREKIARAKQDYDDSLQQLAKDPKNPELRVKALEAGRYSHSIQRVDGKLTIYDEQAITNDLNTYGGGA